MNALVNTLDEIVGSLPEEAADEDIIFAIASVLPRGTTVDDFCVLASSYLEPGAIIRLFGDGTVSIEYPEPSWRVPGDWTLADMDALMVKH